MPPLHELEISDLPSSPVRHMNRSSSNASNHSTKTKAKTADKSGSTIESMIDQFNNSDNTELSLEDLKRFNAQRNNGRWNPEDSDYSLDRSAVAITAAADDDSNAGGDAPSTVAVVTATPPTILGLDYSLDIKTFSKTHSTNSNSNTFAAFDNSFSSIESFESTNSKDDEAEPAVSAAATVASSSSSTTPRRRSKTPSSSSSSSSSSRTRRRSSSRPRRRRSKSSSRRSKSVGRDAKTVKAKRRSAASKAAAASAETSTKASNAATAAVVQPKPLKSAMKKKTTAQQDSFVAEFDVTASFSAAAMATASPPDAKKVQFFPRVRIKRVVNRRDLNLEQINRIWYSREDFRMIRQECFDTIRHMNRSSSSSDDSQLSDEFCSRGLEYKTTSFYQQRQTAKREIRTVVFEEQDFQREQGMTDTMWIAKLSEEQSRACVASAIELAQQDERDSCEYLER